MALHSTIPALQPATVTCTCGQPVSTEGKQIHFCIQRHGRKVVSREFVGFYEGRPVSYGADRQQVVEQLDAYVYDLLSTTAIEDADDDTRSIRRPIEGCDALLAEADAALQGCSDCGTAHGIQDCPAIRALLFAPEDRVPAFAAVPADPWGCDVPWSEAA